MEGSPKVSAVVNLAQEAPLSHPRERLEPEEVDRMRGELSDKMKQGVAERI